MPFTWFFVKGSDTFLLGFSLKVLMPFARFFVRGSGAFYWFGFLVWILGLDLRFGFSVEIKYLLVVSTVHDS